MNYSAERSPISMQRSAYQRSNRLFHDFFIGVLLLAALVIALTPNLSNAAITFDVASSAGANASSTSHSHTFAADANIAIVCLSIKEEGGSPSSATGVTVGGSAATFLVGVTFTGSAFRAEMWYKLAPASGSQTVAATGAANTDFMATGVMSFKGVAQTSTFNTTATATADTANADINSIASAVGEMGVLCGAANVAPTVSPDATAPVSTERYDIDSAFNQSRGFGYTEDGAATSIDMRVDLSSTQHWAGVAVSMRAATGHPPFTPIFFQ